MSGSALILAGPGSGKTTVLTHHVRYLIGNGVSPAEILVITFTKTAAVSMKSRFKEMMPKSADSVYFGTFHSFFFKILKSYYKNSPSIVNNSERLKYIGSLLEDYTLCDYYSNLISKKKTELLSDEEFQKFDDEFNNLFKRYNDLLKAESKIDFDDILLCCYNLLLNNKSVRDFLSKKYKYILIDEFQDINRIQYNIVKLMLSDKGIIYAVGDENQSIYGFRGSGSWCMKSFLEDFDVHIIHLDINFRSQHDIVSISNEVISHNKDRISKKSQLSSLNNKQKNVFIRYFDNINEEKLSLACEIKKLMPGKSIACLFRTNKEVEEFRQYFDNLFYGKNKESYISLIASTVIYYIDYCISFDINALKKIINTTHRDIFASIFAKNNNLDFLEKEYIGTSTGEKIHTFNSQINVLKNLKPFAFLIYLRKIINLEKYFICEVMLNPQSFDEAYNVFVQKAVECNSLNELKEMLFNNFCIEAITKNSTHNLDFYVMTYHQSKGLEFDVVFLPNVIEGVVPAELSVYECNVEEERRLFYVAITRAREKLYIFSIKKEESNRMLPSRFLTELNHS